MVETLIIDTSTMPAEERQFYQETILKKSTSSSSSKSGNGTPTQVNGKLIEDNSPPNAVLKGNNNKTETKEVHRVTFAESHTEKIVNTETDPDPVITENGSCVMETNSDEISSHSESKDSNANHTKSEPDGSNTSQSMPLAPIIRLQRSWSAESHENPFLHDGELSKKADYILSHSKISRTELEIADPDSKQVEPVEEIQKSTSASTNAAAPNQRPNEINVKENGKMEEPLTPASVEVEVGKANATQAEPQQAEQVKLKNDKKCKCCVVM